jgi:hypothetical protein
MVQLDYRGKKLQDLKGSSVEQSRKTKFCSCVDSYLCGSLQKSVNW